MFKGRVDAARELVAKLRKFERSSDTCIVGLLRGGIVTAKVLSQFLMLPMQPLIVKKIGAPKDPEFAIGAIIDKQNIYRNLSLYKELNITKKDERILIEDKMAEIKLLRKDLKIEKFKTFKNIIVADDGVATGATVLAANKYLKKMGAEKVFLAAPVIAFDTLINIKKYFDSVYFLEKPKDFYAVSKFYQNFPQVTNEEVFSILNS